MTNRRLPLVALSFAAALGACADAGSDPVTRVGDIGQLESEARLHSVERWVRGGTSFDALAMRSGGGLAALIGAEHRAVHLIELDGMPRPPVMGGRVDSVGTPSNPPLRRPVDVVGVTPRGVAWLLDSAEHRVTSQDISGRREVVATLDAASRPQTACAMGDATLAWIDGARRDSVFIHESGAPPRALPVPPGYVDDRATRWRDLRFGGSQGAACVLWAPRMRSVMLVSDSAVRPLGTFVEPVPTERWYHRLARWLARRPAPLYVLDATTVPGAVAILYAGRTPGAGRLVDLYDEGGAYLRTMVLHAQARRIAGNRERLYVLRRKEGQVFFASYVLPWPIRRTMREEHGPAHVAPVDSIAAVMRISRDFRVLPEGDDASAPLRDVPTGFGRP